MHKSKVKIFSSCAFYYQEFRTAEKYQGEYMINFGRKVDELSGVPYSRTVGIYKELFAGNYRNCMASFLQFLIDAVD